LFKLQIVGHDVDWVNQKLKQGYVFKLAIFPAVDCVLADWDGIFLMVIHISYNLLIFKLEANFPELWPLIVPHISDLKTFPYDTIQQQFPDFNIR
jgi:hypothetical protein